MKRRQFIKYGLAGTAAAGAAGLIPGLLERRLQAQTLTNFDLSIEEKLVFIFPNKPLIYMWAFTSPNLLRPTYTAYDLVVDPNDLPPVPGPVLTVREGEQVTVLLTNKHSQEHGFAIAQRPLLNPPEALPEPEIIIIGPSVPPLRASSFQFTAPAAGTYLYFDPLNNPVNRIMGLHGALVVLPNTGNTPYTSPTKAIQRLFNDLPTLAFGKPGPDGEPATPGEAWEMLNPRRNFIWLFNAIDEVHVNNVLQAGGTVPPSQVRETFLPRYFTINGRTGFVSAHATENAPHGHYNEPVLIRSMNAALMTHSPHIHGNHVFELVNPLFPDVNFRPAEKVRELDTWDLQPLLNKDVLLPYKKPPDIFPWPPSEEQFGLDGMHYPMHCHTEITQTAAGGNYPQGAITDWVLLGPHQHQHH